MPRLGLQRGGQLDLVLHPLVRGAGPFPHFSGRQVGLKGDLKLPTDWLTPARANECAALQKILEQSVPGFADEWVAAHT